MKIMVLSDGTTFTSIHGCQIVEVDENLNDDEIEDCLRIINQEYTDCYHAKVLGSFDCDGVFHVGVSPTNGNMNSIKVV